MEAIQDRLEAYSEDYGRVPSIEEVLRAIESNDSEVTIFSLSGGPRAGWYEDDTLATVVDGDRTMRIIITRKVD